LASLTKVIATTTVVMSLVERDKLRLDDLAARFFPEWRRRDREAVTVRDLLEHASGLPARLVDAPPASRREFEHEICMTKLAYDPRTQAIYSDLGFLLLGFLCADRSGAPLDVLFTSLDAGRPFKLSADEMLRAAPTIPEIEDRRRGRVLRGEVHDNYA